MRSDAVLQVACQPVNRQWQSEVAAKCKQRFEKNRNKLFTFLGYDGVPWNNNNAEHAMKAFAALRDVIEGTTTASGIEEYLVLLSVSETCRYKDLDVLEFFLSEEKDIDGFLRSRGRTRAQPGRSNEKPTQDRIIQTALEILATHPLILLASDSRLLLKDFTSCCPASQKTPFGFMRGNCPPGDRRRCTSRREGFFDSLGFVKPKLVMLR
ncbi:MAG: hypothetical protein WCA20_14610 [Candidatus Sulfotelmatobacter sp.]